MASNGTARYRYARLTAIVTAILTLLLGAVVGPAAASSTTAGWVWYDDDGVKLVDAKVRTVFGSPTNGGCLFSGEESGGHDPRPILDRAVAINTRTCEARMERGFLSAQHVALVTGTVTTSTAEEIAEELEPEGTGLAVHRRHAWHKTFWEDPVFIDVNSVKVNVRWSYNGTCTSDSDHWTNYGWYTTSKWTKVESNTSAYKSCAVRRTSSFAHFKNAAFCPSGNTTHAYYDRTVIRGRPDGSYTMSWNSWVSGGCASLLHFRRTHGYNQIY